jgi:hypothetical protein
MYGPRSFCGEQISWWMGYVFRLGVTVTGVSGHSEISVPDESRLSAGFLSLSTSGGSEYWLHSEQQPRAHSTAPGLDR